MLVAAYLSMHVSFGNWFADETTDPSFKERDRRLYRKGAVVLGPPGLATIAVVGAGLGGLVAALAAISGAIVRRVF